MKYKEGDKVRIKSLDWYNENKDEYGYVRLGDYLFTPDLAKYCGEEFTISHTTQFTLPTYVMIGNGHEWSDEMIEGLVEEENKPKFKVGDEVRIKGTDIGGTIESVIRGQLIVNSKGSKIPAWPEDVVLMKSVEEEKPLCEGCCSLELKYNKLTIADNICTDEVEIILQDYELKQRGGQWFTVKKEKSYPKTYEECINILGGAAIIDIITYYYGKQLNALYKLLICRDAYWKIAGEEMGLDKPWNPDWENIESTKYVICGYREEIRKDISYYIHFILAFPTEEMRDAFYENFKDLIEECKELL